MTVIVAPIFTMKSYQLSQHIDRIGAGIIRLCDGAQKTDRLTIIPLSFGLI